MSDADIAVVSSFWPTTPRRRWYHYASAAPVLLAFLWWPFVRGARVPVLGWIDLAIHEFGHVATFWMPRVLNLAMGSGVQVMVPLALAAGLWWRSRDPLGAGLALGWAGTSAQDASVYIADAPTQALQLIGGVHDWGTLLGPQHLNVMWAADDLARVTFATGLLMVLTASALIGRFGWLAWVDRDCEPPSQDLPTHDLPTGWSIDPREMPDPHPTSRGRATNLSEMTAPPPRMPDNPAMWPSRLGRPQPR